MPKNPSIRTLLANERTFLAWVRTAIALMAFGFVVDKFNLVLRTAGGRVPHPKGWLSGGLIGFLLVGVGTALLILAVSHYWIVRRGVLHGASPNVGSRLPLIAGGLLLVAALALLAYLGTTSLALPQG